MVSCTLYEFHFRNEKERLKRHIKHMSVCGHCMGLPSITQQKKKETMKQSEISEDIREVRRDLKR